MSFSYSGGVITQTGTDTDLEGLATKWATAGRLEDAEKVAIAMRAYEEVLALIIEDQHPGLSVEVE